MTRSDYTRYQTPDSYTCPIEGKRAYGDAKLLCDMITYALRELGTPSALRSLGHGKPTDNVRPCRNAVASLNSWLEGLGFAPIVPADLMDEMVTRRDVAALLIDGMSELVGSARRWLVEEGRDDPYAETAGSLRRLYDAENPANYRADAQRDERTMESEAA